MDDLLSSSEVILNSLTNGVYVCDRERRIVFWGKSSERITGWRSEDVLGRRCSEGILCHEDKDGHRLCGEEHCPLHRAMITGVTTNEPLIIFARSRAGGKVPMQATTAPIHNGSGEVVGGVETFREVSSMLSDLERAREIQNMTLVQELPDDSRLQFSTFFMPYDIVGGDYYAIKQLDADQYGFLLADMEGHGVAAGLYTMHLSNLWNRHSKLLNHPTEFTAAVNNELSRIVGTDASFATAFSGIIDAGSGTLRFTGAGGPAPLKIHTNGPVEMLKNSGVALGLMEDVSYEEQTVQMDPGDSILLFSDGAFEVHNAKGELLDVDGLIHILKKLDYPQTKLSMDALEEELLKFSNEIRLQDDVTIMEIRFLG